LQQLSTPANIAQMTYKSSDLSNLRKKYQGKLLSTNDFHENPMETFNLWLSEALNTPEVYEANSMALSTYNSESMEISSRYVLLKDILDRSFRFFTNLNSQKAKDLKTFPKACGLFYWPVLHRQIRIQGEVTKLARLDDEQYFKTRPFESKVAACVSSQSMELTKPSKLEENFEKLKQEYSNKPNELKCPEFWGGYVINIDKIEFWSGRPHRLHQRMQYVFANDNWAKKMLYP